VKDASHLESETIPLRLRIYLSRQVMYRSVKSMFTAAGAALARRAIPDIRDQLRDIEFLEVLFGWDTDAKRPRPVNHQV
jgi:hypothetical protein